MANDAVVCGGIVLLVVMTLLLIILLSISFHYVEYDQYGLKKDTTTSHVDYSAGVFDTGRYAWGPGYTTLAFPKLFQFVEYTGNDMLTVFTNTGVNLSLEVSFQYQIQRAHIIDIFQSYGTDFETQVSNIGRASIKNAAVTFGVTDYFLNRQAISNALLARLQSDLAQVWATVPQHKFQLRKVVYPDIVSSRFLNSALIAQQTLTLQAQQSADIYRAATNLTVLQTTAKANITTTEAAAQISLLLNVANAQAYGIRTAAEGFGVDFLCQALNITDTQDQMEFLTLYRAATNSGSKNLFGLFSNNLLIQV